MGNIAKEVIIPQEPGLFRIIFLYVGQGDSTLLVVPDNSSYKYVLIDSNTDSSVKAIDLKKMLKDLFKGSEEKLEVYVNTHPHKDHLDEVKNIYKEIGMRQLWHSGHKPGGEHKDMYKELEYVMKELGEKMFSS